MLTHKKISFFFSGLVLVWFGLCFIAPLSLGYLFLVLILWFLFTAWGSFDIRLNYFTKAHSQHFTSDKIMALTFDDGPTLYTPGILDLLKKHGIKATFFCVGHHVKTYPEITQRIYNEGHTIGNHTYSHQNTFGVMTVKEVIEEIESTNQIIYSVVGVRPKLFRPPFGVTNPRIAQAIQTTKHTVIGWNIRSLDTVFKESETIFKRVQKKLQPGGIILFHDTSQKTITVLEQLLPYVKTQNYSFTTVDRLLQISAYED